MEVDESFATGSVVVKALEVVNQPAAGSLVILQLVDLLVLQHVHLIISTTSLTYPLYLLPTLSSCSLFTAPSLLPPCLILNPKP